MLFDLPMFTLIHVLISVLALIAGLVVIGALIAGARLDGWTALFLVTTTLTSITGFFFPAAAITPAHVVGALSLVVLAALLAPVLYPADPLSMVARPFLWPGQNPTFPLGTDSMGRDVLSGILHGARISLFVGLLATALGLSFGILVGATAGYFGGRIDDLLVRLIEIFQTIPSFVLLVVMVAIAHVCADAACYGATI